MHDYFTMTNNRCHVKHVGILLSEKPPQPANSEQSAAARFALSLSVFYGLLPELKRLIHSTVTLMGTLNSNNNIPSW
jgi:hypothetical protein